MRVSRWLLLSLLLLIVLAGCTSKDDLPQMISPEDAQSRLESGGDSVVLLDVRTPEEFADDGRSPDATLIPLQDLQARVGELDPNDTILVICRSGNRSQPAAEFLRQSGFKHVAEVEGGMRNWIAQGQPFVCDVPVCGLAQ